MRTMVARILIIFEVVFALFGQQSQFRQTLEDGSIQYCLLVFRTQRPKSSQNRGNLFRRLQEQVLKVNNIQQYIDLKFRKQRLRWMDTVVVLLESPDHDAKRRPQTDAATGNDIQGPTRYLRGQLFGEAV